MHMIRTFSNLLELKEAAALHPTFAHYLQAQFLSLYATFADNQSLTAFSLESIGPMVVLSPCESNLQLLGMTEELLTVHTEFVERVRLPRVDLYRWGVMTDNDFVLLLYSIVGSQKSELEAWLADQAEPIDASDTVEEPNTQPPF